MHPLPVLAESCHDAVATSDVGFQASCFEVVKQLQCQLPEAFSLTGTEGTVVRNDVRFNLQTAHCLKDDKGNLPLPC